MKLETRMQAVCREPEGDVLRRLELIQPDIGSVAEACYRIRAAVPRPQKVLADMLASTLMDRRRFYWLVDDVGFISVVPEITSAHVHVLFWDSRLRGREDMCRQMCGAVLEHFKFQFLWTVMPEDRRASREFAKRVGFTELGTTDNLVVFWYGRGVVNYQPWR